MLDIVVKRLYRKMYRKEDAMKEVNVTELRNNLPAYLGMVKAG